MKTISYFSIHWKEILFRKYSKCKNNVLLHGKKIDIFVYDGKYIYIASNKY